MSTICTNNKRIEKDQLHSMDGLGASTSKQVAVGEIFGTRVSGLSGLSATVFSVFPLPFPYQPTSHPPKSTPEVGALVFPIHVPPCLVRLLRIPACLSRPCLQQLLAYPTLLTLLTLPMSWSRVSLRLPSVS